MFKTALLSMAHLVFITSLLVKVMIDFRQCRSC